MTIEKKIFSVYSVGLYLSFFIITLASEIGKWAHKDMIFKNYYSDRILMLINLIYLFVTPIFLGLLIIMIFKKKYIKHILIILISVIFTFIYHLNIFLLIYHIRQGYVFNWFFFWYNRHDAILTIYRIFPFISWIFFIILPIFIFISITVCIKILAVIGKEKKVITILAILLVVSLTSLILSPKELKGEIVTFIDKSFFTKSETRNFYINQYHSYLDSRFDSSDFDLLSLDSSILGEKIFFIQLESVSSNLVSDKITPNLIAASDNGVLFTKFYSNSVQTLRSQESILCGLPPSLEDTIINAYSSEQINQLLCLPKILKKLGYKSLFFKSDSLKFAKTDEFMLNIGFDEIHNSDIMKADDPKYYWGYREDIFYQRVFEYINKYNQNEKIFVYIAVSSTNHAPFKIYDYQYNDQLPYKPPNSFSQYLANTTYIQDQYLGQLLNKLAFDKLDDSSWFVFSDTAWPVGRHPGNIFNDIETYEENYLSFFLFLPPKNQKEKYQLGKIVDKRYSQMDIFATFLEILQNSNLKNLGNSFGRDLLKLNGLTSQPRPAKDILLVQPYNGGFVIFVNYPDKYVFDLNNNQLNHFNLESDPDEKQPEIINQQDSFYYLIEQYFNLNKVL